MKPEVLIVDDERTLLVSMSAVLSNAGYAVRTASNGVAAEEAVRERRPDLVLLDVMMPGKGGLEVCRDLRAADPRLVIVFLTALGTPEDELRALASGGDGYVVKTEPDEVLLARIAALMRLRREDGECAGDFDFGAWRIESEKLRMSSKSGRREVLTDREVAFLRMLAAHPGTVYGRDWLITRLWGVDSDVSDNRLSSFVCELRKKLGRTGNAIVHLRGSGYAYNA